jgi:hypothetical protein
MRYPAQPARPSAAAFSSTVDFWVKTNRPCGRRLGCKRCRGAGRNEE